ncbi:hypothetical protein D3C85_1791300 [compost metagenome]
MRHFLQLLLPSLLDVVFLNISPVQNLYRHDLRQINGYSMHCADSRTQVYRTKLYHQAGDPFLQQLLQNLEFVFR